MMEIATVIYTSLTIYQQIVISELFWVGLHSPDNYLIFSIFLS